MGIITKDAIPVDIVYGWDAEIVGGQGWNKDLHYPRNRTEFGGDSMAWFEYADCMAKTSLHHYTGCHIGLRQNMDGGSLQQAAPNRG